MSKLQSITMVFDDKIQIVVGGEAAKYQKHMKNLMEWASKAEVNPFDKDQIDMLKIDVNK